MKSKIFSLLMVVVLFAFFAGAQAQDKTKETGKDKTKTTETKKDTKDTKKDVKKDEKKDNTTTENKDTKTTKKIVHRHGVVVKVNPYSIDKCVEPGKTFSVNIDVNNYNKKGGAEWNSGMLKVEVDGPFTFSGSDQAKLVLLPGEYGTYIVKVKAPEKAGKETLKITVTNDGKKVKTFTKKVKVGVCSTEMNHGKKETKKEKKEVKKEEKKKDEKKDVKKEEKKDVKKN